MNPQHIKVERSGYAIEVLPLKDVGIRQLWDKNK